MLHISILHAKLEIDQGGLPIRALDCKDLQIS